MITFNNICKKVFSCCLLAGVCVLGIGLMTSCNDDPDSENYYTFTGQMMSDYIKSSEQFSKFAAIVEKAGLMDQLSAYGHYTLFLPDNAAMDKYLAGKGINSIDELSEADCDTIARTHLMDELYTTIDMNGTMLPTKNMLRRNVQICDTTDANNQATVCVNYSALILFDHKNDSVENGVVQQIDAVLENSTRTIAYYINKDEKLKIFAEALHATGLDARLDSMEDMAYKKYYEEHYKSSPSEDIQTGARAAEAVYWPEEKLYGFTIFAVPDDIMRKHSISSLKDLYDYACSIYDNDSRFGADKNGEGHAFENATDPTNPLYRLMAYHILNRNVQSYDYLTVRGDCGIDTRIVDPTEWYETLLPHTMIKVQKLYTDATRGYEGIKKDYYLNRRVNLDSPDTNADRIYGVHVQSKFSTSNTARNGIYFYVDDILKYDETTRIVQNTRIRMDFSTIFPEVMNNGMRMNGPNITESNVGRNYRFPAGYLEGVTYNNVETRFIYWYPKSGYYSMNGDEFDIQNRFDMTFTLPPVPATGDYQLRLGFAPMSPNTDNAPFRGQVQVYFNNEATGLPLNFAEPINQESVYGSASWPNYSTGSNPIRNDSIARQSDFKLLKNKGYFRGPYSVFGSSDGTYNSLSYRFSDQPHTARKVLCTVHMEEGKTYTLRMKNVSNSLAQRKEAMLDYLEIVPKSVYGISDGTNAEDDL